jgi:hypothetical protein
MNKIIIPTGLSMLTLLFLSGCGNNNDIEPNPPIDDNPSVPTEIPTDCITWFDGCNNCQINTENPDMPMACTAMFCEHNKEPYCVKYKDGSSDMPTTIPSVSPNVELNLNNATYSINGTEITLVDGKSEMEAAPGSATKIITTTSEFMAEGNLQSIDETLDGVVILIHQTGGTGTFYYLGGILEQSDQSYLAIENTQLLGDRIEIQNIEIKNKVIYVTYLDRNTENSMATTPTVEIIKQYSIDGTTLVDTTATK